MVGKFTLLDQVDHIWPHRESHVKVKGMYDKGLENISICSLTLTCLFGILDHQENCLGRRSFAE